MPAGKQAVSASWTATLRLPQSRFPPRPVPADRAKYLQRCGEDLYQWQRVNRPPKELPFLLHDGPPYANGSLHVGHALNKILKDITCRTRLVNGRRVDYVPGWDCHGLPIEIKALERLGVRSASAKAELSPLKIREAARDLALRTVEDQKAGFQRWAIMGDWNNAWKTMDKDFELAQLRTFKIMLEKGLIYQRNKPVFWSPSSRTALAEAELEYNPSHQSTAAFVKFPLTDVPKSLKSVVPGTGSTISATIWTTTPWTLVANRVIGVHATLEYSIVRSDHHGILIAATSRISELENACGENLSEKILKTIQGSDLVGLQYTSPLLKDSTLSSIIVHADFVSSESGTGLVHMAPGHGMEDYKLCQGLGIEPYAPVDDAGSFDAAALPPELQSLAGKDVIKDGTLAVLDLLTSSGALVHSHTYEHSYPYDWRSKQPVIVRATQQWFANVESIRKPTLQALDAVQFIPESGKEKLSSLIRSRTEWCISRQRAWGVPIPALYEETSNKPIMTPESVEHIINVMKTRGSDAWWTDDACDPVWVLPSLLGQARLYRGQDTMDVWFDSGSSWSQIAARPSDQPQIADIYLEGTDQHRGWFQSSLLTKVACGFNGEQTSSPSAPYKTLITHGFTLDQHGRKMSKFVGNVIDPEDIMQGTLLPPVKRKAGKGSKREPAKLVHDGLGADALRMWVAATDYTRDLVISKPILQAVNNSVLKLRVTFRLLLGFLESYQPSVPIPFSDLELNNQLALIQLHRLSETVRQNFDSFEYYKAVQAINNYVANDLSAGYVEAIKDRMYTDAPQSPRRIQTQVVVWQIFKHLVDIMYPITPLLVEEVCDHLPSHLTYHPVYSKWQGSSEMRADISGDWQNGSLEALRPYLTELNTVVKALQEQARLDKKMGSSLQSDVVMHLPATAASASVMQLLQKYRPAIEEMLVVSSFELSREPVNTPSQTQAPEWSYNGSFELDGKTIPVTVRNPARDKCVRCWKYTVPQENTLEDSLCLRCVGVLEGLRNEHPDMFVEKPQLDAAARACRTDHTHDLTSHWDFKPL